MTNFIGEYNCKLDSKGRLLLPSSFKKQMDSGASDRFVIKKDIFENCLVLYPIDEWERQNTIIRSKTNPYNKEHSQFLRAFFKGTAEIILDSSSRLLIPKRLLDEIKAEKEVVLAGQFGKIEIWSKDKYNEVDRDGNEIAGLAEKILGSINLNTGE